MTDVYLQMFSVAQEAKADFVGTLERVAELGYAGIEFGMGNYGGMPVQELNSLLRGLDLAAFSSHTPLNEIPNKLDFAEALAMKNFVVPTYDFRTYEQTLQLAVQMNEVGRLCADRGICLSYHNHNFEFLQVDDSGMTFLELLMEMTDPEFVSFQLDVGWATYAGVDCPAFIRKHAGRFSTIHFRECNISGSPEQREDFTNIPVDEHGMFLFTEEQKQARREKRGWNVQAGTGVVDWQAVQTAAVEQGSQEIIVERESRYHTDVYICLKDDLDYLKQL